jgi:hypothetical protein
MIGVIANPPDHPIVREFFELFKTPWEFHQSGRSYPVVLCADGEEHADASAALVVVCAGASEQRGAVLAHKKGRLPVYGPLATFPHAAGGFLTEEGTGRVAAYAEQAGGKWRARIGYGLLHEVRTLLTLGQPAVNAALPALELHIAILRDLVVSCGIPLVEVPPEPESYPFAVCLTHDVDHPSLRRHGWDRTTAGFLYRALVGSVFSVARGRMSLGSLLANWAAAAKLPLVQLGLAKDPWDTFGRYLELERGLASTFFVIPFAGRPGRTAGGSAPLLRASGYGAADIAATLRRLAANGCEIGVHGIDAWLDAGKGREELEEVRRAAGAEPAGARMHWLYWQEASPAALEQAGFAFDSTAGYNEAVGYRAGTAQAYKPLNAEKLLELPLHIMDTALFYPDRLNLAPEEARQAVEGVLGGVQRFGGVLVINWHDRSIAPERLWEPFYIALLEELKRHRPWFATASQAVAWFRKRRSVRFEDVLVGPDAVRVKAAASADKRLPGLRLRVHTAAGPCDVAWNASLDTSVPLARAARQAAGVRS